MRALMSRNDPSCQTQEFIFLVQYFMHQFFPPCSAEVDGLSDLEARLS